MAFAVNLYQFHKIVNSTAIPAQNAHVHVATCELKDDTNLLSPVMIFSAGSFDSVPLPYNYAYIEQFHRYYFVKAWRWISGRWECQFVEDVLGSYRSEIGASSLYVTRAASAVDPKIMDSKYPTTADPDHVLMNSANSPWSINIYSNSWTAGFFIIGIINHDSNAIGATSYYAFTGTAMRELFNILFSAPSWMNITDASISTDLQKMISNPMQYISSVVWIPCGYVGSDPSELTQSIPYGWWTLTLSANTVYRIGTGTMYSMFGIELNVPKHPQAGTSRAWLNSSPYSSYSLEYYPFGMITLDSYKLLGATQIRCQTLVDYITGKATLRVCRIVDGALDLNAIYATTAQVGIPISLGQISVEMGGLGQASTYVKAAVGTGVSVFDRIKQWYNEKRKPIEEQDPELASGKQILADVADAALSTLGNCESKGATGAFAQYTLPVRLVGYFAKITNTDDTRNGFPLCAVRRLDTLSGFILVSDASTFTASGLSEEIIAVQRHLEAGFYYE